MAVEQDFTDHQAVLRLIEEVQSAEQDMREQVEEQKEFILLKDGMWDQHLVSIMGDDRYRGTFDQVSPILDQITGEIDGSQFAIAVSPAGGDASEDTAQVFEGLIRNIENISNADQIYSQSGGSMVMSGIDGFEIVQDFIDANTFDQDLIFKTVSDWYKSVWFDLGSVKQDKSDANWAIKLREMPTANFDKQFPKFKGEGVSIGDNVSLRGHNNNGHDSYESVTVGKLYYKKPINIEIIKMTSGAVYVVDDKFESIRDELTQAGEVEVDRRTRKSWRVWTRLLDGANWLSKEEKTVFTFIPLVPFYGNYEVFSKQNIYFGKVLKLMDPQRGLNFAISTETETVAMSPPPFIMMTKEQGSGNDYSKMNVDRLAVRFVNHVDNQVPPQQMGGIVGNPGLQNSAATFQALLQKTGNMDDPSMGQNPGLQSGTAINALVQQSNNGNVKWFKSMEIGICHAYRICVDAIPRVYDATRTQRILNEDGTNKMVTLNTTVFDQQSQQNVELNDLTKGIYDVTCSMGAAFANQQEKATESLLALAAIDPEVVNIGRDLLWKNQTGPGMKILAKRARKFGIDQGTVLEDELTQEEQQEIQAQQEAAAQQPPQEDPNLIFAKAEELKGQAEMANAQNKQAEVQGNLQIKSAEIQLETQKLELEEQKIQLKQQEFNQSLNVKFNVDAAKIQQGQEKLDQEQQKIDLTERMQQFEALIKVQQQQQQEINDSINNLKVLREASGIDSIIGVGNLDNIKEQTEIVDKKLDEQD